MDDDHVNSVHLRGRVSGQPTERVLPSGDVIVTARLVIRRPVAPTRPRQPVDTLDCLAVSARTRRSMLGWEPGAVVEVNGAVRRRFRRGPEGASSRVEIEVTSARRVRSATRPG